VNAIPLPTAPLKDYRLGPASGVAPQRVVIFLHGLGDSGSGGLLDIGRIWQPLMPTVEFLCPDAPFAFDMGPPDFGGRQWFSLCDYSPASLEAGIDIAAPLLDGYIDHVLTSRNITPAQLALVGFSQGTMMALHTAPRRAKPIAALVGYSGKLVAPERIISDAQVKPPVMLIHGCADPMVPFAEMGLAEAALKTAGFTVQTLACPGLGHRIDDAGLESGQNFLRQHGF
jgi:phospholipase/carboxylesterase